jgi:hypothetical protein
LTLHGVIYTLHPSSARKPLDVRTEKVAWFGLALSLVGLAWFGGRLFDPALDATAVGRAGSAAHRVAVIALVWWVTLSVMTFASAAAWEDERDVAIRQRAGGLAYGFLLTALTVGTLGAGYGLRDWVGAIDALRAAQALLALPLATAAVQSLVQVVLYRRQAR